MSLLALPTNEHTPEAGLPISELGERLVFEDIQVHLVDIFREVGADEAVTAPAIELARQYFQEESLTLVESILAIPDTLAVAEEIDRVTGQSTNKIKLVLGQLFHDIGKTKIDKEAIAASHRGNERWGRNRQYAFVDHVYTGPVIILGANLPAEYAKSTAYVAGNHHGIQPPPSIEYQIHEEMLPLQDRNEMEDRRVCDSVRVVDWVRAKLTRDNDRNRDEHGVPLSDEVRWQQIWDYLQYLFAGEGHAYWNVSETNNQQTVIRAVYERLRTTNPSRSVEDIKVRNLGAVGVSAA